MPDTFSQIYIQVVFAVKNRENLIKNTWSTELYKYIAGTINSKNNTAIIVNGMADHIHAFVGLSPVTSIATLVREIKNNSSNFVNKRGFTEGKFLWQEGYGAFSYSRSQLQKVYDYILNQEEHHKVKTFKEEYVELLNRFEVDYDERYVFE